MAMRHPDELPEDFMRRVASYFSETARTEYIRVAEDISAIRARVARLEEALKFVLDECDWEESANEGGGDNRIGPAIRRALEEKWA